MLLITMFDGERWYKTNTFQDAKQIIMESEAPAIDIYVGNTHAMAHEKDYLGTYITVEAA